LNIYDIRSFDPELAMILLDFQALAHRRMYTASNLRKDCQNISDLSYRGCKVGDLAIDFVLPGYPEYILSSGSSSNSVGARILLSFASFSAD
jgi:E3 ubiquitin-protein ligase TRIP12